MATIEEMVNINGRDEHGQTCMHKAASALITVSEMKILLEKGAEINAKDNNGQTPLHLVASTNPTEIAHSWDLSFSYSDNMAEQQEKDDEKGKRIKSMARLLLESQADVNAKDNNGQTPLHLAVTEKNTHILEVLLEHNADVNAKDKEGQTPLHLAATNMGDNTLMMKKLLEKSANPDITDNQNKTPLHLLLAKNGTWGMETLLISKLNVNLKDINGDTPLHLAVKKEGFSRVTQFLLEKGADVNAKNSQGQTAIDLACNEQIKYLLRQHQQAKPVSAQSDPSLSSNRNGFLHPNQGISSAGNNLSNEGAAQPGQKLEL